MERHFAEFKIAKLTAGVDLEKSFGPVYTPGLVRQGRTAFALLGVNAQETQASIDAALTFGILWLDVCRRSQGANMLVEGLKMFVPAGTSALVRELKADEDIHLPLQGLDYWSRVEWHHARGEFPRFGYVEARELSTEKPLLFLVAPALHVYPSTDTLLRYLSPEIEWEFVGIDERWREGVKVVFRKRPDRSTRRGSELLIPCSRLNPRFGISEFRAAGNTLFY